MAAEEIPEDMERDSRSDFVGEKTETVWDQVAAGEERLEEVIEKGGYKVVGRG